MRTCSLPGRDRKSIQNLSENLEEKDHIDDLGLADKMDLKKLSPMMCSCEHGNEPLTFAESGEFIEQLNHY
jgi:hypothetical protein